MDISSVLMDRVSRRTRITRTTGGLPIALCDVGKGMLLVGRRSHLSEVRLSWCRLYIFESDDLGDSCILCNPAYVSRPLSQGVGKRRPGQATACVGATPTAAQDWGFAGWYAGLLPREAATALLAASPVGCFLLRESQMRPNEYSITVVTANGIEHVRTQPVLVI